MKKKGIVKVSATASILLCFLVIFNSNTLAVEIIKNYNVGSSAPKFFTNSDINFQKVEPITIVPYYAILQGKEFQMQVEQYDITSAPNHVEWSSSDKNIISCSKDGKIKGIKNGKAVITVKSKYSRSSDSITVYCVQPFKESTKATVRSFLYWTCKIPFLFSIQELLFNNIFMNKKVTVLGYYGDYFYVTYEVGGETHSGFIWAEFLPSNIASDEIFRQLSVYEITVFCGYDSDENLTTNYKGNVDWAVSDLSIISFNSKTGIITGLKPGTTVISATVGTKTLKCKVSCVNKWYEPETTEILKDVTVRAFPASTGSKVEVLSSGSTVTAVGDTANGSTWVYISSGSVNGFISLTDFPGIDRLMTEYHYYDKGFELRYESPVSNIYTYSSVLNNIMMNLFNLKICPYVKPYTSIADWCKIQSYGLVTKNNLALQCPESGIHNPDSCLSIYSLGEDLINNFGKSKSNFSKVAWTGHILKDNERSASTVGIGEILITPYGTVDENYGFANASNEVIREDRIYTLVHETGHQLGLVDHYCLEDFSVSEEKCSNPNCWDCNKQLALDSCVMYNRFDVENTPLDDMFCDNCKKTIKK